MVGTRISKQAPSPPRSFDALTPTFSDPVRFVSSDGVSPDLFVQLVSLPARKASAPETEAHVERKDLEPAYRSVTARGARAFHCARIRTKRRFLLAAPQLKVRAQCFNQRRRGRSRLWLGLVLATTAQCREQNREQREGVDEMNRETKGGQKLPR